MTVEKGVFFFFRKDLYFVALTRDLYPAHICPPGAQFLSFFLGTRIRVLAYSSGCLNVSLKLIFSLNVVAVR